MAEEIINKTGTGVCLSPLDIGKITILLSNIINNYPKIDFYKPNDEEIAKYDRSQLSSQLASTLDQAISEFKEKRK